MSLYGEVQKEVIQATLADEYGVDVTFRETTTICVERLAGTGGAAEVMGKEPNPFLATVGLRVEPAPHRLRAAPEPRPRHLRQEHVEHGR
ncbi:Tetracycline resistance protein TetM [Streptomyces sp. S4.7]|nr:Tetracycline resistance protein TetM [Streptomyces sp. S4.7]